jgi:LysR family nitrogen assimilation transcriptional regulator
MNLRLLESFLRVAELGSISRAAIDLSLSQSALSRHMALLEHELKVDLFLRDSSGVTLSEAGEELVERARALLGQADRLREEVGARALGTVNIAMPLSMQRSVTSNLLAETLTEDPQIRIRAYEGINNVIRETMRNGLPDLCMVAFTPDPSPLYQETPLLREQLYLVGDRKSGLTLDRFIMPSDLEGLRMILPGRPNVIRQMCENHMRRSELKYVSAAEVETLSLCLDLVTRGLGYTVMPFCALYQHPARDCFRAAPIRGMVLTWSLAINCNRLNSRAVDIVLRRMLRLISTGIDSGMWQGAELTSQALEIMHAKGV